ncbi:MAG: PAS domain S-box protein [Ignavibacteriaceae bacterium]|nr:PAS domain S-box protein [Ignavibacteriaceae bacterium]
MTRILIVDDNQDNLYLLESLFDPQLYTIDQAKNGREAFERAKSVTPELIISDILMPVMDGYTLCIECKKDSTLKKVPFIFYTATYTDPKDEEFALHLGASRFVLKPQEPDVFLEIIQGVLREVQDKTHVQQEAPVVPEKIVLKEYNQTLIRKLEEKMLQAEKAEAELREYTKALENEISERKRIERVLRESENRFRSLYNDAVVGLYRTSPKGDILLANRTLVTMLGFTSFEELASRNLQDSGFSDQTARAFFKKEIEEKGEVKEFEAQWKTKEGKTVHVRESAKAIRNEKGEIIFYDGIVEDITYRKIMEQALTESRTQFDTLALTSPVGIFKTDPDGLTTYVNIKWCELAGITPDEAMGDGWLTALHPDDRERIHKKWKRDSTIKTNSEAEYRFVRHDGSVVWVIGFAVPEMIEGRIAGYIGTITDVTELKQTELKLRQLNCAVEQSPVHVMITDTDGIIQYVNPKFEEVTGYTKEDVIGRNPRFLKSGLTKPENYKVLWQTIKQGNTWKGEFCNKKKNGELYWESAVISPILGDEGEIIQFLAVKEDISKRKEYERELIIAKEKAEEMNHLKTSFLANMSHELRTPLISILGYSELLIDSNLDAMLRDMALGIKKGGDRLLATFNNLLHFSKIESENIKPNLGLVDVNDVLDEVVRNFRKDCTEKGIDLITDYSPDTLTGYLDVVLLKEIFSNLISNAVKFTEHGYIRLQTSEESGKIVVKIIDTGIGISDEHKNIIFEEFRQASEGLGRYYEGTGLGLTITNRFVKILGGEIFLESQLEKGSTFTLVFSGIPGSSGGEGEKNIPEKPMLKKLLYIEDDRATIRVITEFLKGLCHVDSAVNAKEGIAKLEAEKYDLFLLDINLGVGMNGKLVAAHIKSLPQYKDTPVIAVTAYAMHGDKEEFLAAGCSDYISKPFSRKELIAKIKESVELNF